MPKWKPEEIALLKELYSDNDTKLVAEKLNKTVKQVYHKVNYLGIKKSDAYIKMLLDIEAERLKKYGEKSRFKPEHQTWNKGVKGYMGVNKTSYKVGNLPHNTREIGEQRIDKDGHILVKVAHNNWVRKQKLVWESVHGKIPKGYVLRCKDGNKHNFNIENLMLITMSENMKLNTIHHYPQELKQTIKLVNKLKRVTHEKQNSRS